MTKKYYKKSKDKIIFDELKNGSQDLFVSIKKKTFNCFK